MGINSNYSIYGMKDYAAEFREKNRESVIRMDQMLKDAGITVPIGKSDKKDENKGITLEHQDKQQEEQNIQQKQDLGNLAIKENRKAAEEKIKNDFLKYGANGEAVKNEKEAKKMAKEYVKNEQRRQESERTTVFMDKDAYKAAEKERDQQYDKLYDQYRDQGLSRRKAKEKANAELGINEYVKKKNTRAFVENHEDMFYDENGNFSSDKFKDQAVNFANTHTKSGEVENQYLSLKERREVAARYGVNNNVIADIANKANIGYEKDYTELYQAGTVVGATALGAVAGHFLLGASASASAAGASASAGSGAGAAGAAATATAEVSGILPGAATGAGLGAASTPFIRDKGNKEPRIYQPDQPEPQPQPQPEPEQDKPPVQPEEEVIVPPPAQQEEEQPCPVETWQSEFCDHTVKRGDDWTKVSLAKVKTINGKKPDGKILKAYVHAEKLKHGVTDFSLNTMPKVGETMRVYSDFSDLLADEALVKKHPELLLLKGAQIELNCDGETNGRTSNARPRVKYTPFTGKFTEAVKYKQGCNDPVPVPVINEK